MKLFLAITVCSILALGNCAGEAEKCTPDVCKIENNCRCSSAVGPTVDGDLPQLVSLTFDEAVVVDLINNYWNDLLFDLVNPDGQPIGGTFFVPHEYTDYSMVAELYNYGFEIGVHSISKNSDQEYWRSANLDVLVDELGGAKQIISRFAKVPSDSIKGVRTPQLQLAGNISINAYKEAGLVYDSSWPTLPGKPLFPYSLDYLSTQDCSVSKECPNESFPGQWVLPIIDLQGKDKECHSLATCGYNSSKAEIVQWLNEEITRRAGSEKAPLTLIVESYWFEQAKESYAALREFLVSLTKRGDVFLVSQSQVLDWIKNPVPLSEFATAVPDQSIDCRTAVNCRYQLPNQDVRYMVSCIPCPKNYPWLGNHEGN